MLDYGSLVALAAVVREGGFERAAAMLGVSPSSDSQCVRALEERVGTTVVVRGQPPVPTEAGAKLCAHVERVRLLEGELAATLPMLAWRDGRPATLRTAVNADSLGTPAYLRSREAIAPEMLLKGPEVLCPFRVGSTPPLLLPKEKAEPIQRDSSETPA